MKRPKTSKKESSKDSDQDLLQLVKFKSQLTTMSQNKIISKQHKHIMAFHSWVIEQRQYQKNNWKPLFKEIQEALCTFLRINENSTPTLLNQILYPKFSHLQHLELKQNCIQNIEALCFLDIEIIKEINLQTNEITNLTPMDKLNLPHLSIIKFLQNPIETSFEINRMKCLNFWLDLDLATNSLDCSRYQVQTFRFFPKIAVKALFFKLDKNTQQVKKGWKCAKLVFN